MEDVIFLNLLYSK